MGLLSERSLESQIDLSLVGFLSNDLKLVKAFQSISFLNDSQFWTYELEGWINYIRNDFECICPDGLREINYFGIGLQFTDDVIMRELNQKWRQNNNKTDVLSFPVFDQTLVSPLNNYAELGDIIISVPTAQRQAFEQNHKLIHELRWLVSHGLLHLLGWDHPDPCSLSEMLNFQEQLLGIKGNL